MRQFIKPLLPEDNMIKPFLRESYFPGILVYSFSWPETPQGKNYWSSKYKRFFKRDKFDADMFYIVALWPMNE